MEHPDKRDPDEPRTNRPNDDNDLLFRSIAEVGELLRRREVSPIELTRAVLDRIDRLEPILHAHITVTADWAMERARTCEREILSGQYRGPLHGIPIGLKDLVETASVLTTAGSKVLGDHLPTEHATVVARLLNAGVVIVGKHNMHEFAYGYSNVNPHNGSPSTPWKLEYCSGGSSGGTGAAIAAGLCFGGLGSDTGGSIRVPSSWCGIAGLKPTYGRVSLKGVIPLSWSLDHVGPMARSAEDCGLLLNAIAGYDRDDPSSIDHPVEDYVVDLEPSLRGKRIGVIRAFFELPWLDPAVAAATRRAVATLESLGASLEEIVLPGPSLEEVAAATFAIIATEASAYHAPWLESRAETYPPDLRERLRRGARIPATSAVEALRRRAANVRAYDGLMEDFDAIVGPTTPYTARPLDGGDEVVEETSLFTIIPDSNDSGRLEALLQTKQVGLFTIPFDFNGLPALSIPCGFDAEGLPIGLTIGGRRWGERRVIEIGHAYQQATDWHRRRPPLD
jgi:aspartyl-tRNA(Asn)/glutamyl-tRNA(Gln) amidotransferase subunit A